MVKKRWKLVIDYRADMSKVKDTVTKIDVKRNHFLRRIIFNYLKIIKVYERKAIGTYYSEHFLSFCARTDFTH